MNVNIREDGTIDGYLFLPEFSKKYNIPCVTLRQWIRRGYLDCLRIADSIFLNETYVVNSNIVKRYELSKEIKSK